MTVRFMKCQYIGVMIFYLMMGSVESMLVQCIMFYDEVTNVHSEKFQDAEIMIPGAMLFII